MRIIFLDFDGVLNHGSGQGLSALVDRCNKVTDTTGAKIVVHSSWRYDRTVETLRQILRGWGITGDVIDKCPWPVAVRQEGSFLVTYEDWASFKQDIATDHERAIAIQRWLNDHPEVSRFVIFDDEDDLGHFVGTPAFLQTQTHVGLTDEHTARAIALLSGP